MVTRAIVSNPNYDQNGKFLIDALINRGLSGGPVVAMKGKVPNYDLVGIISSVPTEKKFVLTPGTSEESFNYSLESVYQNEPLVDKIETIRYGIGKVVPAEVIKEFLKENTQSLYQKGFSIDILNE
jgi:S1-C subfamily serine protease